MTEISGTDVVGNGEDIIWDFEDGKDKIDLSGFDGITSFADFSGSITNNGTDAVIYLTSFVDTGAAIIVVLDADSLLDATDFIFA